MPTSHVQEHIELIARHEEEFLARRTATERLGDAIAGGVGSLSFTLLQIIAFAGWILWNTARGLRHFDPYPFSLLGTALGFEAILIASFILMRQARMTRRAEERDHLMLQVLLLSEKEITTVLRMDRQIAREMGLDHLANDSDVRELSRLTSIDEVAETIKDTLSTPE